MNKLSFKEQTLEQIRGGLVIGVGYGPEQWKCKMLYDGTVVMWENEFHEKNFFKSPEVWFKDVMDQFDVEDVGLEKELTRQEAEAELLELVRPLEGLKDSFIRRMRNQSVSYLICRIQAFETDLDMR